MRSCFYINFEIMRKITTILLVAILAVSCSTDNPEEGVVNVELEGNWVLENVFCFCYFESATDFSNSSIAFTGSILSVRNDGDTSYFMDDGDQAYTVAGNLITLQDGVQYRYQLKEGKLTLAFVDNPEIADDEISFVFFKR